MTTANPRDPLFPHQELGLTDGEMTVIRQVVEDALNDHSMTNEEIIGAVLNVLTSGNVREDLSKELEGRYDHLIMLVGMKAFLAGKEAGQAQATAG